MFLVLLVGVHCLQRHMAAVYKETCDVKAGPVSDSRVYLLLGSEGLFTLSHCLLPSCGGEML